MAFQRFVGHTRASSPSVSILAKGLIVFNEVATRKFALNRFNYAILFYDPEAHQIGVQFSNNAGEPGVTRIIKKPNGLAIGARSFLEQHGLLPERNVAFHLVYSGEHDMYIIQMPEDSNAASSGS